MTGCGTAVLSVLSILLKACVDSATSVKQVFNRPNHHTWFHMSDHPTDRTTAGSWATYAEAGERFGITAEAIRLRARRLRWRTQRANDGRTLVWIPEDTAVRPRVRPPDRPYVQPPDQSPGHINEISQLTALLTAEHERADRAEQRADEANKRSDIAIALADKALTQTTEAEKRAEQAEIQAKEAVDRAILAESGLTGERNRAERAEKAAEEAQIARAEAEADAAAAREAESRARKVLQALEELRAPEAGRAGQRRWARLRAAWRGE
jgi:hypothetical protein